MDWIHCNNCALQPKNEGGKKFVTTNCGHIYCEDCTLLPELKQCRICQSSYQIMPLSSKMSKDVEIYFRNPIDDIQKYVKVLEFQQSHRLRLTSINMEKLEKYGCLKKEFLILKEEFKRLEKENAFLLEENKRLNNALAEYKRKTDHLRDCQELRNTPIVTLSRNGYDVFPSETPKLTKLDGGISASETHCRLFKRPPEKQNFFIMSSAKDNQSDRIVLQTPTTSKMPGSYRSLRTLASDLNSPTSFTLSNREIIPQKDLHCRKVKLPGDRGGPSPSASAFRRLAISKMSSFPKNKIQSSNKYSHYFSKP